MAFLLGAKVALEAGSRGLPLASPRAAARTPAWVSAWPLSTATPSARLASEKGRRTTEGESQQQERSLWGGRAKERRDGAKGASSSFSSLTARETAAFAPGARTVGGDENLKASAELAAPAPPKKKKEKKRAKTKRRLRSIAPITLTEKAADRIRALLGKRHKQYP